MFDSSVDKGVVLSVVICLDQNQPNLESREANQTNRKGIQNLATEERNGQQPNWARSSCRLVSFPGSLPTARKSRCQWEGVVADYGREPWRESRFLVGSSRLAICSNGCKKVPGGPKVAPPKPVTCYRSNGAWKLEGMSVQGGVRLVDCQSRRADFPRHEPSSSSSLL